MTTLRSSQLLTINVLGGVSGGFLASQLLMVSVSGAPAAVSLNASQLFAIAVVAYGQDIQPLGNPIKLNCWSPCGSLIWRS